MNLNGDSFLLLAILFVFLGTVLPIPVLVLLPTPFESAVV